MYSQRTGNSPVPSSHNTSSFVEYTCISWKFLHTFEIYIYIWPLYIEEFGDTKGAIRIRKSKKNRQHNGKKVQKDKQRSTKHTYKTQDRVTRTPLKTGGELRYPEE